MNLTHFDITDVPVRTQTYSSANTSVNTMKLPAIYNKLYWQILKYWGGGKLGVFDIGCGKETSHIIDFLHNKDIKYFGYDPYWGPIYTKDEFNDIFDKFTWYNGQPIILCSNVFNVLHPWKEVEELKEWIKFFQYPWFATVYEGDKSGVGKQSKSDCWQWNKKITAYCNKKDNEVIYKGVLTDKNFLGFIK